MNSYETEFLFQHGATFRLLESAKIKGMRYEQRGPYKQPKTVYRLEYLGKD